MKRFLSALLPLALLWLGSVNTFPAPIGHHFANLEVSPSKVVLTLDGTPLNITGASTTVSNQFRRMFDSYVVDASSDLREWTRIGTILRANSDSNPVRLDDPTPSAARRFYRVVTNQIPTAFPKPTGRFAVGTIDRVMSDPSRTNMNRYIPGTNTFMVTFWYPSDPPPAGLLPAKMWDQKFASDTSLFQFASALESKPGAYGPWIRCDSSEALLFPKLVGHSFTGLPLASGGENFPVILFSGDTPGGRKFCSHVAEELASHGYIVIAMDHTDCWAVQFPNGVYLGGGSPDLSGRLKDMRFLLDQLADLNNRDPLLGGRMDTNRIGALGKCAGGVLAEICRTDDRVRCVAIYDAEVSRVGSAGVQKPLMIVNGEYNMYLSMDQSLFNKSTNNAAIWAQIHGAGHVTATDCGWTLEAFSDGGPPSAVDSCLVWFFAIHLRGESPTFPTNPEIYNLRQK